MRNMISSDILKRVYGLTGEDLRDLVERFRKRVLNKDPGIDLRKLYIEDAGKENSYIFTPLGFSIFTLNFKRFSISQNEADKNITLISEL